MSTISASTTSTTAFKITTDTTGALVFQTGASPTTAMTLGSDQSVTFAGTPTYSGGTANGVAYLNGSKVLTTGTALVFDGSSLGIGTASPSARLHVYQDSASTTVMSGAYIQNFSSTNNSQAGIGFFAYDNFNAKIYTLRSGSSSGNLVFATNGGGGIGEANVTERARIDSSGNLLVGTTTSAYKTTAYVSGQDGFCVQNSATGTGTGNGTLFGLDSSSNGVMWSFDAVNLVFGNTNTERARIDTSGNLVVGATSAGARFEAAGSGTVYAKISSSTNTSYRGLSMGINGDANVYGSVAMEVNSGNLKIESGYSGWGGYQTFWANGSERARIDTSGNLMVGCTNPAENVSTGFRALAGGTVSSTLNSSGGVNSYHLYNTNGTLNGYRFYVGIDGGIRNYSGNNVNLSDERTKTNIELAGSYLEKICSIPVKLFNYKDEAEGEQRTLGVIAQDVEAAAPELVDQAGWMGGAPAGEAPLKSIYTTDMMFALMKCIQELNTRLEAVENK